jgi:hypothetical protein
MTIPTMPRLLEPVFMRALLLKFCRPTVTWRAGVRPSEQERRP